jgi:dihydroorotase
MIHPFAQNLVNGGQMHEGEISVNLGLKGIPYAAETTKLLEDIELAKWLKTPFVVLGISSKSSVDIIRKAKTDGVKVKAVVPILNLVYDDSSLENFNEEFKVLPPLRSASDRLALIEGLIDGTIDGICSNHTPQDIESKKREFPYSEFGASVISEFPKFIANLIQKGKVDQDLILSKLYHGNRIVFNQKYAPIEVGNSANITGFSMSEPAANKSNKPYNLVTSDGISAGVVFQYSKECK